MTSMRTVQYDRYGPPEVLHVAEEPAPSVGTRDVLVRVAATTVNHGDVTTRAGKASILTRRRFPKHTSIDFVGEVVGFGGEVTSYRSGDHVWGLLPRSQFLTGKAGAAS